MAFLLEYAMEWRSAADELRARGVEDGAPALGVWREAAWCHLLLKDGRHDVVIDRLRALLRQVVGADSAVLGPRLVDGVEALVFAADVFDQLRSAISAQYPDVFACPVPA
jgi:hypothetical protein